MTNKLIKEVEKALEKGAKWTLGIVGNDKSLSIKSLRFEPIELTTGLTASAFLDAMRVSRGEIRGGTAEAKACSAVYHTPIFNGITVRGMTLSRAAEAAGKLIGMTRGKAAKRLREVFSNEEIQNAIAATDEATDRLTGLQARVRQARRATERAINRGFILDDPTIGANAREAEAEANMELAEAREALRAARTAEDEANIKAIAAIWGDSLVSMTDGSASEDEATTASAGDATK